MRLFLYECKKILFKKMNFIVLIVFTLLVIFAYQGFVNEKMDNIFQYDFLYEDGSLINREDEIKIRAETKQQWIGTMDESWWNRLEKANYEASKRWDQHSIDFDKMTTVYGNDWYDDYFINGKDYVDAGTEDSKGKKEIYYNDSGPTYSKQDIKDNATREIFLYGKTMMEKKSWNTKDGNDGIMYSKFDNEEVPSPVYTYDMSKEELRLLRNEMNGKDFFHYGDSKNLDIIFNTLSIAGILLLFWIIMISGNIVNKERKQGMLETLSTCKRGKNVWFSSKLMAVLSCSLFGLLVMIGALLLYAGCMNGIGDLSVNATESVNMISILTYGEALTITIVMMLLGVFIMSAICVMLSTYLSSSYVSMAVMLLLLLISGFGFLGKYHVLMPDMMVDADASIRIFTMSLFGKAWFIWDIRMIIWIPVCVLLVFISWKTFTSKSYKRI